MSTQRWTGCWNCSAKSMRIVFEENRIDCAACGSVLYTDVTAELSEDAPEEFKALWHGTTPA